MDIGDRPHVKVYVFVMEHADHRVVQAYSGEGIGAGGFVEPAVRLPDGLLRDAHPVTRCRNARHISPEECLILLLGGEHFGCLVEIINLLVKIGTRDFQNMESVHPVRRCLRCLQ